MYVVGMLIDIHHQSCFGLSYIQLIEGLVALEAGIEAID